MTILEVFFLSLGGILLLWALFAPGGGHAVSRIIAGTIGLCLIALGIMIGLEDRDGHRDREDWS